MSESERPPHTKDGILRLEALVEFIRRKVRRNPPKKSGLEGSMTLPVSARPNGDRKQKAKQYEIAVTVTEEVKMWAKSPQTLEKVAFEQTADMLFALKQRGAVFAGELGDLLNNCDDYGFASQSVQSKEDLEELLKEFGIPDEALKDERFMRSAKYRYPSTSFDYTLPRIAEKLLPKEPDTTQGVDDIPF